MMCPEDTRIAFMGGAHNIAALEAIIRLADAGFEVVCGQHDPREGVVLLDAGIPCVNNRFDAISGAQVVITCCARPADVEDLYLGDNGLLEIMDPGATAIDMSLTTPRLAREIQAMAAISDLEFVDAPVVNMGEGEQSVCFIGGETKAVEAISPLMPYLAATIHPAEEPGEGQFCAMMAYIGLAGSIMGAIEAMAMAHIAGIPNKTALNALASTSAASRALVDYIPQVLNYNYAGRIHVVDLLDALDIALDSAEDLGITLPMVETAYQLYDLLGVVGGDEMNIQALALLYEDEQTCADYGLDWALAEEAQALNTPQAGPGGEQSIRDLFEQAMREVNEAAQDAPGGPGPMGGMGAGPGADWHNHGRQRGGGGPMAHGGTPSAADFFSMN